MTIGVTMFLVFLFLLGIGFSVSFAMILSTSVALMMGGYTGNMLRLHVTEGIKGYTLIAIPLFIIAGNLTNTSGITQRIFDFAIALIEHIIAGLSKANFI